MRYPEGSRVVPLTKGYECIVDEASYHMVSRWSWRAHGKEGERIVAVRTQHTKQGDISIVMHRYLMNLYNGGGFQVDHINQNTLDNRLCNLRIVNGIQNQANRSITSKNTTGYKGVHQQRTGSWSAHIRINGTKYHLGTCKTLKEAADLYDTVALEWWGQYSSLNGVRK